ncbi:MAG TPA: hypothetical protein VJQ45_07395, partial [Ktedonobacterales bacterium]|nr:hypothetical protein [Ktedonobacterales bacterium]
LPLVRQRKRLARQLRRLHRSGKLPALAMDDRRALFAEERESAEARLEGAAGQHAAVAASAGGTDVPVGAAGASAAVAVMERPHEPRPEVRKRVYARAGMLEHKRRMRELRGERGLFHTHPLLRGLTALLVLGIATAGVASMSEGFAHSVEELIKANPALDGYEFFLGLILIPVLAGMVELYGSISAARENRMEITMAVTAGATIQMILLVVPVLVFVGLLSGTHLNLIFQPLDVIVFGIATFVFMLLARDGESTWLEGTQLTTLWLLVAVVAFFFQPR